MTRINTNVSSLSAQKGLARSNDQLQQALTRLSTGLRINAGKDDPAGLIASEVLRADITATEKAITNTERANQVIGTADSALGQVSSLLNDIRGLVTEAANDGGMSDEQIAANQLQIDSSLEALNRIAQTTTFQGRKLLDGSLDFITSATANFEDVSDLQIDQANLGTTGQIDVEIAITTAATQAALTVDIPDSVAAVAATDTWTLSGGDILDIDADVAGTAANGIEINVVETAAVVAGSAIAAYDETNGTITVQINDGADTTLVAIKAAIDGTGVATATVTAGGDGSFNTGVDAGASPVATLAGGTDTVTGLEDDLVFQLSGSDGAEVFTFDADTEGATVADAINLVSDATGVSAAFAGTTLTLTSSGYGTDALVAVEVISEGALGSFESGLSDTRDTGEDIVATVNGVGATGDGNQLSINTATLDLTATIEVGETDTITFSITGGGALFQIGPEVVSNQQIRMGIQSVNTASLGGTSGRLYELGSGGSAALATDTTTAAEIVGQAQLTVTSLRGRLGAMQRASLDTNIAALSDTLEALTAAESAIRDADFAAESAALTRAQILVQSGVSVLSIANQNPQNVLSLLR